MTTTGDWQSLLDRLKLMQKTDLVTCLTQGDIIDMLIDARRAEMQDLRKQMPDVWRDMGGKGWRKVCVGDIAVHMRLGSRTVQLRHQVSLLFGEDILPRNPDADLPDIPWTTLAHAVRFAGLAWDAVQWGIANDLSSADMQDVVLTDSGFSLQRKAVVKVQEKDGKRKVTCPCGCGVSFEIEV